jgi:hypothetical protein
LFDGGNSRGTSKNFNHPFPNNPATLQNPLTPARLHHFGFRRFPSAAFGLSKEGLPEALSGEQMLRVPIARALVIETLRKLNAEDTTIVVVTHDEAIVSF